MTEPLSDRRVIQTRAGEFEEFARAPHPALADQVLGLGGYVDHGPHFVQRRELPLVGIPVIFTFGSPFRVSDAVNPDVPGLELPHFLAGLHDTYSTTESTGASWLMQLNLTPLGAIRTFGMPLQSLSNRIVAIEDVLGGDGRQLITNLEQSVTWTERFDLIEGLLLRRLSDAPEIDEAIRWSWDQLYCGRGTIPIGILADETGWSRRHFASRFRNHIGLSPKLVARQLRFTSTARLLLRTNHSLSDIANRLDYSDQAHFTRDFREFSGESPAQFRNAQSANR
jgi:AraC-like DNA-binding protein